MHTSKNFIRSFLKYIRAYLDPVRGWFILIALSGVVFVAMIVWNVWTFQIALGGGIIGTPPAGTSHVFDSSSFEKIHTIFTDRASEEEKYVTGAYRYIDPSQ